jgi:hypothetical protein
MMRPFYCNQLATIAIGCYLASIGIYGCQRAADRSSPPLEQPAVKELTVADIDGKSHALFASSVKGTLLLFVLQDCPIANAYAPKLQRICDDYTGRGIAVYFVQVDPAATVETLRQHAQDYDLRGPILHDRAHELVRFTGASVTPQAVLYDQDGQRVYSGRIDDQYVALGAKRPAAGQDDLVLALEALLEGKPIEPGETKAIGCYIADLMPTTP